ncbi:unnamed protein product [Lampetra planeri]
MLSRPPSSSSVRSPPSPATVASGHAAATRGDWGLAGPGLDHQQDTLPTRGRATWKLLSPSAAERRVCPFWLL